MVFKGKIKTLILTILNKVKIENAKNFLEQ